MWQRVRPVRKCRNNDYTTSEGNNKSPLSTKVQSAGLSTTISLKALPKVESDKTISGWFETLNAQEGQEDPKYDPSVTKTVNVSAHKDRAEAGVIPFYARTADATAMLTVQAVDEEGNALTADQLPQSVQVTIGTPYTVAIGTSAGATITAPMDFTANDTHYAYMKLGKKQCSSDGHDARRRCDCHPGLRR